MAQPYRVIELHLKSWSPTTVRSAVLVKILGSWPVCPQPASCLVKLSCLTVLLTLGRASLTFADLRRLSWEDCWTPPALLSAEQMAMEC